MTLRTMSFGGGVQSTAVLVLAAQGKVRYDHFLFANVGDDSEDPDTLRYVREIAMPYAEDNQIDLRELHRVRRDGTPETLYGRLTKRGSRSIPIPMRMSNGAPGTRSCTADFKIRVIAKTLRELGATKDEPAITGLGISTDEIHRARTDSGIAYQVLEYPLIDLGMSRADCIRIIADAGLPVPSPSSCFFCPFHSAGVWQELKRKRPALFEKSAALEDGINADREPGNRFWMHRPGVPLRQAIGDQMTMFDNDELDNCESGYCFT